MKSALLLFAITLLALSTLTSAKKICLTEDFTKFIIPNCGPQPDSIRIFNGFALNSIPAGVLTTAIPLDETCEISFGSCSTYNIDATHPVLVNRAEGGRFNITFSRVVKSFTIGKGYVSEGTVVRNLAVKFYRKNRVVLSDILDRATTSCEVGSSRTWAPSGGFDTVTIAGTFVAVTDLQVCYNGASIFHGGCDDDDDDGGWGHGWGRSVAVRDEPISYTDIVEGECVTCTDALGQTHYLSYVCDADDNCVTKSYTGAGCLEIGGSSSPITLTIAELSVLFPVENTVCHITDDAVPGVVSASWLASTSDEAIAARHVDEL